VKVFAPQKMYFKIGEVSEISGVKPHVLRYWETEFKIAKPMRSRSQQRVYKKSDVDKILLIKKLLYEDKYSIAGAKKKLREIIRQKKSEETKSKAARKVDQTEFCFDEKKLKKNLKEVKKLLISVKESLE
jgi:DNA-binding transcriptional MerR regulator